MRMSRPTVLLTIFLTMAGAQSALAQSGTPLSAAASRDGYTMQWLLPERSVSLVRPGLSIVVRPGVSMYFVNNHVEFADRAPVYTNTGDLIVSPSFASRIAHLAVIAPAAAAGMQSTIPAVAAESNANGPVTISVRPVEGRQAVVVNGHAPSSAPVTITLFATFDAEVPTVVLSRHDVQPDVSGNFQAEVPIAADYIPNTILRVVASSVSGTTPASAQLIVGAPNSGVTVPLEQRLNPVP